MSDRLTGRIRHRNYTFPFMSRQVQVLVLQVEDAEPDGKPFWRDAQTTDLTTINLKSLQEVKQ